MTLSLHTDPALLSYSSVDKHKDALEQPRLNGSEGIPLVEMAKFNDLYNRLRRLRKHASNLLLDLSCAHTLDTGNAISQQSGFGGEEQSHIFRSACLKFHLTSLVLADKGQVYKRQLHEAASILRTMKDFAFDISGIYRLS